MNLQDLTKVIPHKWRVQSFSKNKPMATVIAYIDARDVQKILDEVVGPENWQDDYKVINNNLFCGIGIRINSEWVWKWDCGTESEVEKEKGESSDSFKRAAVKWGVGRFLYDMGIQYLPTNAPKAQGNYPYVVDKDGKQVYDISAEVNKKLKQPASAIKKDGMEDRMEKHATNMQKKTPPPVDLEKLHNELLNCLTVDDLKLLKGTYQEDIKADVDIKKMFNDRYNYLTKSVEA